MRLISFRRFCSPVSLFAILCCLAASTLSAHNIVAQSALADYYQNRLKNDPNNLELMTRLGRILVSAGRLEEASSTLMSAVERAPEDSTVRLGLVDVLERQSKITEARQQYEQLAKQDPTNPDYLLKWGQLLLEDQTKELADRRKSAAVIWQRLAKARSDDAVTLAQVADRLRSIDQSDHAIALYRKSIKVDPVAPQYREYLGEYLHQLDRKDEAIEVWEAIAQADRRGVDSLIRLAEIFATFKLAERSLETWKAASEYDFTFSQELRYANQLRAAKQFDESLARLEVAEKIAESPDERDQLLSERITTYSEAGTLSDRIAELKKTTEPATAQLKELALMHQAAGQMTDALVAIKAALTKGPENINVLSVAAEILERQNRFADAGKYYRQLADVDRRFQTNYLEKVAQLQVRLGLADDAIKTCEELIQTNPASTDTYLFAARTAFQLTRTDEGIEVLRRAMTVARRDNGPRRMLASEFAKQYRTDEAVDLYWQALDFESKLDNRIDIIRSLAPLYERRAEVDTLLSRIEEIGAKENDLRATQMMIAAANEAIQDYGSARQAIDRLLSRQPRDVGLLETMVRLCDAANELEMAIDFQQRIVTLADTPENRYRLVNLQLDAGTIDIATALSQRVSMAKDPSRIMSMIQAAARRGDSKTAISVARQAIDNDDSLWDVKLILAQILLHQISPNKTDSKDTQSATRILPPQEEALDLCKQIMAANYPPDQRPPTAKISTKASTQNLNFLDPISWGQSGHQLVFQYQVGRYSQGYFSSRQSTQTISPFSFGHAKILAQALSWIPKAKSLPSSEFSEYMEEQVKTFQLPDDLNEVKDASAIWRYQAISSMAINMSLGSFQTSVLSSEEEQQRQELIIWRLLELAPKEGSVAVLSLLQRRLQGSAFGIDLAAGRPKLTPLNDSQLKLLTALYDRTAAEIEKNPKRSRGELLGLTSAMGHELRLAGKSVVAAKYQPEPLQDDASLTEVMGAIQFYLSMNRRKDADALVSKLLPAVRVSQASGAEITEFSSGSINGSIGRFTSVTEASQTFVKEHRNETLDVLIASAVHNQLVSSRGKNTISTGTLRVYQQTATAGSYRSISLRGPLSADLMSSSLAKEITALNVATSTTSKIKQVSEIDDWIIEHLLQPLPDAPIYEQKARSVAAAFAYFWKQQPQKCYDILATLGKKYPDDVNIRIEQARMASELGNDREALDILNSFEPLDSKMLVRKEMAALNLAARVSDEKRAAQAAERLFGMRMDTATQLALNTQLRQFGMKEKAAAVLQRLRGGRKQDDRTRLQIAESFMKTGDDEAAAEVAFQVLRNVNRSRNQQGNYQSYKRQAIEILKSAERLEPLIAMAKRRFEAAPKSVTARTELAELYTAAGNKNEAEKLWAEVAKGSDANPAQLITQAKGLAEANKHKEAVGLYLKAFQKQPQLISSSFSELQTAARISKAWDEVYLGMIKIPANQIPQSQVSKLINGDYTDLSKSFSDAKMKFAIHILESGTTGRSLDAILLKITDKDKEKYPKLRKAIIRTVTNDAVFQLSSQTWAMRSYSSDGYVSGALKPIVEFISGDNVVRDAFDKAAEKWRLKPETGEAFMARFLQAIIKLKAADEAQVAAAADEVLTIIKEMETIRAKQPQSTATRGMINLGNWNGQLSQDFLWQAGNLLETVKGIPNKPHVLLAIYESAEKGSTRSLQRDPRNGVLYAIVRAYRDSGQTELAVQRLLDVYRTLDFSYQNQSNPGYGDYQDLQSWQWIAEQLQRCDAPIQALAIYRRGLADKPKFERARRWGGQLNSKSFQAGADKAIASISEEVAIEFLKTTTKAVNSESAESVDIDLQMLPIDSFDDPKLIPSFLIVIHKAKASKAGIDALDELFAALKKQATKKNSDWSLTATQLIIATAINQEQIADLSDQLIDMLPTKEEIQANPIKQTPFLDCFSVALALSECEHADATHALGKLANILLMIATEKADTNSMLIVEKRFGDPSKAVNRILTVLESHPEGRTPNTNEVALALNIAVDAAMEKNWEASTRALKAALGRGRPLAGISTTPSGDAFAITTNQPSFNRNETPDQSSQLNLQLLELTAIYESHLQLNEAEDSSKITANVSPEAKRDADIIFAALLDVVIPKIPASAVDLYECEIASRRDRDRFQLGAYDFSELQSQSVAKTLVAVAAQTGRVEDVYERLNDQIKTESIASITLRIQLAMILENIEDLSKAIISFEALVNDDLPEPNAQSVGTGGQYRMSSQMQIESYQKSQRINSVLIAVWDVVMQKKLKQTAAAQSADRLLRRTIALIGSDSYTINRHGQLLTKLQSRSIQTAAANGNQSLLSTMTSRMAETIADRYAASSAETKSAVRRRVMQTVLTQVIKEGYLDQSHVIIRQIIESHNNLRPDYKNPDGAIVLRAIAQLPKPEQYELLKRITFGDNKDAAVLLWMSFVRASEVPELVQKQTPDFGKHKLIPTCADVVPISDTALMLADVAAELGRSDSLLQLISDKCQHASKKGKLLSMLVQVTRDGEAASPELIPSLNQLLNTLKEKSPEQGNRDLKFPELETVLIIKAINEGVLKESANSFTQVLKNYSVRASQNVMTSAIGALRAKLGFGRTAGGSVESPLEHFVSVSLPWYDDLEAANIRPFISANQDGWISSTGGYNKNLLMLRYPVVGSFTVLADINDGSWGEAGVCYGGTIYEPGGWHKMAAIDTLRGSGEVKVPVPSIQEKKLNSEGLLITPEKIVGLCNDIPYLEDLPTASYPWASVLQHSYRTTQWKNFRIKGSPVIPTEVNLLDAHMRGWGTIDYNRFLPSPSLPTTEGKMAEPQTDGGKNVFRFKDGELSFETTNLLNRSDSGSRLQYLRPLLENEKLTWKFHWIEGLSEVHPSIGRVIFRLSQEGIRPEYRTALGDLSTTSMLKNKQSKPASEVLPGDVVPEDSKWNTVSMERSNDVVKVSLNGQQIAEVSVTDQTARPGFFRDPHRNCRIKEMILTGDWPETLPENLMKKVEQF